MSRSAARSTLRAEKPSLYLRRGRNVVLKRSRRRRFVRRGSVAGAVLVVGMACLAWLGAVGLDWLESTPLLGVQAIALDGTRMADTDKLRTRLAQLHGVNLLAVDLPKLRGALLDDPWVKEVVIRRVFPHTITVEVRERTPIAAALLDETPTVVDASGAIIVPWSARLGALDLPLITGVQTAPGHDRDRQIRAGIAALVALRRHDADLIEHLSELDLSRRDRITARLIDESAPLLLDRDNVTANLDHYLAIRDDLRRRVPEVEAIDLRWRGRVVVVPRDAAARSAQSRPAGHGRADAMVRGGRQDG